MASHEVKRHGFERATVLCAPVSKSVGESAVMATSPTTLVKRLYEAINQRDYEAGFAMLDDDFEWVETEEGLLGGHHRGFAEVQAAIERQLEVFDEFEIEPEEFHEHGEHVAVPIRQRARGGVSGAEVEIRIGHLWTVRDGKVTRLEVFPAREDALRAAERGREG